MNYCKKCGSKLEEGQKFCKNCGCNLVELQDNSQIRCVNCGSSKVNVQIINETHFVKKGKGCLYWLFIGWWLELLLWFFFTVPRLLFALFGHKKQSVVNNQKRIFVCQNCGTTWE